MERESIHKKLSISEHVQTKCYYSFCQRNHFPPCFFWGKKLESWFTLLHAVGLVRLPHWHLVSIIPLEMSFILCTVGNLPTVIGSERRLAHYETVNRTLGFGEVYNWKSWYFLPTSVRCFRSSYWSTGAFLLGIDFYTKGCISIVRKSSIRQTFVLYSASRTLYCIIIV